MTIGITGILLVGLWGNFVTHSLGWSLYRTNSECQIMQELPSGTTAGFIGNPPGELGDKDFLVLLNKNWTSLAGREKVVLEVQNKDGYLALDGEQGYVTEVAGVPGVMLAIRKSTVETAFKYRLGLRVTTESTTLAEIPTMGADPIEKLNECMAGFSDPFK